MSFAFSPYVTFGSSGGGGGSTGTGRITVADAGALYTSVNAAMAAGHKVMAVIGETTENALVTVPSPGMTITIDPGANLNMGSGYFQMNSVDLQIDGGGSLEYMHSSAASRLFNAPVAGKVSVADISINNSSPVPACITNATNPTFSNVTWLGTITVCSASNMFDGCIYNGNTIFISPTASNSMFDGSIFNGVQVSDSGVNTLIADSVVY